MQNACMEPITIPTPDVIRAEIARRTAELREMRKLLRLSEAAVKSGIRHDARMSGDRREAVPA